MASVPSFCAGGRAERDESAVGLARADRPVLGYRKWAEQIPAVYAQTVTTPADTDRSVPSYFFVSPNTATGLTLDQAIRGLASKDERALIGEARRLAQCLNLPARTQPAVVAEVAGHHGVGRVVEFQGELDELGTGVEQSFRMHGVYCPTCLVMPTDTDLPPLIETPPGRYRHYKGGEYEVVGVARHSETLEPMVLYRPLYNASGLWVRPYAMFLGQVDVNGRIQSRFQQVTDAAESAKPE